MPNIVSWLIPVVIVGGGYVYNSWMSRRGDFQQSVAEIRLAGRPPAGAGLSLRSVLVFMLGLTGFLLALHQLDRYTEARHPAVKEHRAALMEMASRSMNCPRDSLTLLAQEPTRARVEGCGKSESYHWKGGRMGNPKWYLIDPNCTYEFLGCTTPCQ